MLLLIPTEALDFEESSSSCPHDTDKKMMVSSGRYPHCTGKFHYSDPTCEYDCLVSEYEWWSLTTILGGQDGTGAPPGSGAGPRCDDISNEWESCTKAQLMANDPTIVSIMTDPKYGLPTKLPYGLYKPNSSKV